MERKTGSHVLRRPASYEDALMRKPVIGVMPLYDDEKDSFWMIPGYFEGLETAGAVPVMLSLNLDEESFVRIRGQIDGYLFTGGHDIDPALYGEKPIPQDEAFCARRDRLETMIFSWCWSHDVPALGICRGIQLFNVARGGSLWQDIPSQFQSRYCSADPSSAGSSTILATEAGLSSCDSSSILAPEAGSCVPRILHTCDPPYEKHHAEHAVTVLSGTPLFRLLEKDRFSVNSYHHQAVKEIGSGLAPMALSDDGLTEALYAPSKRFLWAVQWHPEFTYRKSKEDRLLFTALVRAAAES